MALEPESPRSAIARFVYDLFKAVCDPKAPGLSIRMEDDSLCRIELFEINGTVQVRMDGQDMGRFEPWNRQGYDYAFYQKLRRGMSQGYNPKEVMLMSMCENHPLIRLFKAVNG